MYKKTQAQNSKKIWDTIKRENSQIRMKGGHKNISKAQKVEKIISLT